MQRWPDYWMSGRWKATEAARRMFAYREYRLAAGINHHAYWFRSSFVILSFCQREEGRGRKENVCLSRIQTGCWYQSPCLLVSQQFCHFVILSTGTITNRKVIAKYEQAMIEAETTVDNIQDADLTVHDLVQIRERNYVSVEL